jgi:hypothetical protein
MCIVGYWPGGSPKFSGPGCGGECVRRREYDYSRPGGRRDQIREAKFQDELAEIRSAARGPVIYDENGCVINKLCPPAIPTRADERQ